MSFAPDGRVLRLAQYMPSLQKADSLATERKVALAVGFRPAGWERLLDGRIVSRNCSGVIVAEYLDPKATSVMKIRPQRIVI